MKTRLGLPASRSKALEWALIALSGLCFLFFSSDHANARRKKKKKAKVEKKEEKVSKKASLAIKRLAEPYKWGLSHTKILKIIEKKLQKEYLPRIRKAKGDPLEQDRLRRDMAAKLKKISSSYVKFTGQKTSWDSSVVDDQFVHKNEESLLVMYEQDQQRFFFFHNGKMYKHMIAFNADHPKYKGLTFTKFLNILYQAYGMGQSIWKPDSVGVSQLHHVEWHGQDNYILWALDKSAVYGNFCLVLIDGKIQSKVEEGRKALGINQDKKPKLDPLIKSVTKPTPEE